MTKQTTIVVTGALRVKTLIIKYCILIYDNSFAEKNMSAKATHICLANSCELVIVLTREQLTF